MLSRTALRKSLELTRDWFQDSGVMTPENGVGGVAERVLLLKNNKSAQKTLESFPVWTPHTENGYCVVEHRRADCCLETAFMFLRLHEVFGIKRYYATAHNILSFLFYRSGLLNRVGGEKMEGTWNWSHIDRLYKIYFDDNAWVATLLLKMSTHYPEFDKEFGLKEWGLKLADLLADALPRYLNQHSKATEGEFSWAGNPALPHWGSLVVQALAEAAKFHPKKEYRKVINDYHKYLVENIKSFTTSEYGYALLGATASYVVYKDQQSLKTAKLFADSIVKAMDPKTGNMPSQHYEAPKGKQLVDTIYTMNWAVLAMQNMRQIDQSYTDAYDQIMELLLRIQDHSESKHLRGSWHGMYDLKAGEWGGGSTFEGGASSLYSGWTNAPIAWAVAFALQNKSFVVH